MREWKNVSREAAEKVYNTMKPDVDDREAMLAADQAALAAAKDAVEKLYILGGVELTEFESGDDLMAEVDWASIRYRRSTRPPHPLPEAERKLVISLDLLADCILEAVNSGGYVLVHKKTGVCITVKSLELECGEEYAKIISGENVPLDHGNTTYEDASRFVSSATEELRNQLGILIGREVVLVS